MARTKTPSKTIETTKTHSKTKGTKNPQTRQSFEGPGRKLNGASKSPPTTTKVCPDAPETSGKNDETEQSRENKEKGLGRKLATDSEIKTLTNQLPKSDAEYFAFILVSTASIVCSGNWIGSFSWSLPMLELFLVLFPLIFLNPVEKKFAEKIYSVAYVALIMLNLAIMYLYIQNFPFGDISLSYIAKENRPTEQFGYLALVVMLRVAGAFHSCGAFLRYFDDYITAP